MYLVACGLVTPVGLGFPPAAAAMRAGISAFAELPYHDGRGKVVIGAEVPQLAEGWRGHERLERLLVPAVLECLSRGAVEDPSSVPVIINIAERGAPGRPTSLDDRLRGMLSKAFGSQLHPGSLLIREGRAGAAHALGLARRLIADGCRRCVISGVDSLVSAEAIAALARANRLKTELNPDGLIPGEAAGAVLLEGHPRSDVKAVEVAGLGFGHESVRPDSDDPILGLGLAEAMREALREAGIDVADASCRLSDLTGEKYFFLEANYALGRLLRRRKPEFPLWHPMDSIGDSGAAAGFCLLGTAMAALTKGYAPGEIVLCQMSAESGRRAAVVVRGHG